MERQEDVYAAQIRALQRFESEREAKELKESMALIAAMEAGEVPDAAQALALQRFEAEQQADAGSVSEESLDQQDDRAPSQEEIFARLEQTPDFQRQRAAREEKEATELKQAAALFAAMEASEPVAVPTEVIDQQADAIARFEDAKISRAAARAAREQAELELAIKMSCETQTEAQNGESKENEESEEKDPFVRVVFSDAATALELGSQLPVTTSIPAVEETAEAKVERMRAQRLARFAPR